jgi:nicotinamide mononucleotide transporter
MNIFDINNILFTILDYPVSALELIGTIAGMLCVYLTAREKVICWPVGIVNIVFFFIMFYQVQLYSDMLLQIIFFIMTIYGWWKWTHPKNRQETNSRQELKISKLNRMELIIYLSISLLAVILNGTIMLYIHDLLPAIFPQPAAFPYADAFTTVFSLTATILMARKKIECWLLWITVDIAAVVIYFLKGINLVAIEYIIFGIIALTGFLNWKREQNTYAE